MAALRRFIPSPHNPVCRTVSNPTSELAVPLELPEAEAEPGLFGDLMTLTKARLSLLRALGHMDDWLGELRGK